MISIGKAVRSKRYDPFRLVDQRFFDTVKTSNHHIVCDIDKTYLETDIESVLKLARTALEGARAKQTVAGAATVLHSLRWSQTRQGKAERPLHFVSASPPQMRGVLSEKLAMDGLDWTSDTFKNQAYNLRRRRFDLLREQMVYKTLAVLGAAKCFGESTILHFVGDNAESDPMIYLGLKLLFEKLLSIEDFIKYLVIFGVEQKIAESLCSTIDTPISCTVGSIHIRKVTKVPNEFRCHPLGTFVKYFDGFFEVACDFWQQKMLSDSEVVEVGRRFHNHHGIPLSTLTSTLKKTDTAKNYQGTHPKLKEWACSAASSAQSNTSIQPQNLQQVGPQQILEWAKDWYDLKLKQS